LPNLDGLELRRMEARIRILRPQRTEIMLNLDGLTRSSLEARIEYLIQQQVDGGETRQFAELSVTRTDEGRALWKQARKLRMAESADNAPESTFSHNAASLTVEEAKLENLIAQQMSDCGETHDVAERAVIHCADGLACWNRARALRLAESRDD